MRAFSRKLDSQSKDAGFQGNSRVLWRPRKGEALSSLANTAGQMRPDLKDIVQLFSYMKNVIAWKVQRRE